MKIKFSIKIEDKILYFTVLEQSDDMQSCCESFKINGIQVNIYSAHSVQVDYRVTLDTRKICKILIYIKGSSSNNSYHITFNSNKDALFAKKIIIKAFRKLFKNKGSHEN